MADCDIPYSAFPVLTGCPGSNELFLVANAVGGLDVFGGFTVGYAQRKWSDLLSCVISGVSWVFTQFTVGQGGSLISQGSQIIIINAPNYISDSLTIFLGGTQLTRNDNTQISYTYTFSGGNIAITLNQPAVNGQQYIILYGLS